MRAVVAAVAALAGVAVPVATAAPPSLHAVVSPAASAARPATLRLSLRTELQCGALGSGTIAVGFPAAERMPPALESGDVLVDGKALRPTLSGHVVQIALPKTGGGITCTVIAPATVTIVFTKAASLGNPTTPGTYHVSLRLRGRTAVAPFVVS